MTDIALIFNTAEWTFDAALDGPDLATDRGLNTAIYLSLFSNRRADDSDTIPDGTTDKGGWWGDYNARVKGDKIGSRLWLLKRSKMTPEVIRLAGDYVREALQWLTDDGIAAQVIVTTERQGLNTIAIRVEVLRPDGKRSKFDYVWEAYNG